jgi:lipopolysaccharide biosynthesis glycosyltransferase
MIIPAGQSNQRQVIAMTGDSKFIYPLGIAMASLARHATAPLHLDFALPRDWPLMVSPRALAQVAELAESLGWTIDLVECPIDATSLPRTRHISSMTFMKPAYFDISQRDQVAFIDGDLIAVAEWTALLQPLLEHPIGAAREDNMRDFELRWNPELPAGWYINAGVLQARPSIWQARYTDLWHELLAEYPSLGFRYLEQDLMNASLRGNTALIPQSLNARPAYGHSLEGASIVHFAGWWKPWLTVPSETRRLPPLLLEANLLFIEAERFFHRHIEDQLGRDAAEFWRKELTKVRGVVDWRSQWRFRRWWAAQKVRTAVQQAISLRTRGMNGVAE